MHYYGIVGLLITLLPTLARAQAPLPFVYPPAEYDRPYEGLLIVNRLNTEADVRKVCPKGDLGVALGCAYRLQGGQGCIIIMVSDEVIRSYRLTPGVVLRHETGHCNAWHNDHRGRSSLGRRNEQRRQI